MKAMLTALLASVAMAAPAIAQNTYTTAPNGIGGWTTYGPNGQTSTTTPNGIGGYNTYGPNGQTSTTTPNGIGGWNTYTTGPRR